MRFIQVHDLDGFELLVNISKIIWLQRVASDLYTEIVLDCGPVCCKETPDEIQTKIRG